MAEKAVELPEFVLVEYRRLVGKDRTRVRQTVANRPGITGVVPGDQEMVEVDADADDSGDGDPAQSSEEVQAGVEAGEQPDGDGEQEVVFRVDGVSLGVRFGQPTLMGSV